LAVVVPALLVVTVVPVVVPPVVLLLVLQQLLDLVLQDKALMAAAVAMATVPDQQRSGVAVAAAVPDQLVVPAFKMVRPVLVVSENQSLGFQQQQRNHCLLVKCRVGSCTSLAAAVAAAIWVVLQGEEELAVVAQEVFRLTLQQPMGNLTLVAVAAAVAITTSMAQWLAAMVRQVL
jgi:hypothetical protein